MQHQQAPAHVFLARPILGRQLPLTSETPTFRYLRGGKEAYSRRKWQSRDFSLLRAAAIATGVRLIMAEKPKVAKQIAAAAGAKQVGSHFEGKNMIITSACGHLLEFKDVPWSAPLPKFPSFDLQEKLLKEIKTLASRADILVNACDAGREGELIFRRIQAWLKLEKMPFERLWLQSLTGDAIRNALQKSRPGLLQSLTCSAESKIFSLGCDYDNLADAADCRARWDWLIGINGTCAWLDKGCSVGRVMTPTLLLVVNREEEIEKFKPKQYQDVRVTFSTKMEDGETYEGKYTTLKQKDACDWHQIAREWKQGLEGEVIEESSVEVTEKPKPLMNLADLQRACSRLFKMTPTQTLECAQNLYLSEKITYPRTDSRFLPNDHKKEAREMLQAQAEQASPTGLIGSDCFRCAAERVSKVGKRIFDDQKVTDHFAIIPTNKGLKQVSTAGRGREDKVLNLIARHYVAAFLPDAKFMKLQRKTQVQDYIFMTNEKVLLDAGDLWSDLQTSAVQLKKGAKVFMKEMQVEDKETKPPPRYTQLWKHVGRTCQKRSCKRSWEQARKTLELIPFAGLSEHGGIGTSATRASIIEKLLKQQWVAGSGAGTLRPCIKARNFKQRLLTLELQENFSTKLTGLWELQLREIEEGKIKKEKGDNQIHAAVESLVKKATGSKMVLPKVPVWKGKQESQESTKLVKPVKKSIQSKAKKGQSKKTKATKTTKTTKTPTAKKSRVKDVAIKLEDVPLPLPSQVSEKVKGKGRKVKVACASEPKKQ
eukprot:symbB.v1.2.023938.t1/scaffold2134.1/size120077/4